MSQNGKKDEHSFVSLAEFEKIGSPVRHLRGNVIKSEAIRVRGSRNIKVEDCGPDAPRIVIHKEGDCIEGVEFVCPCGKSSSLSFVYEDQSPPSV